MSLGLTINSVAAGNALDWYKHGWKIFLAHWVSWVLMTLVFFVIVLVLGFIPFLGVLGIYLLLPLLQAGMVLAADKAQRGESVQFVDLFAAFQMNNKRVTLLVLGGIMLATALVFVVLSAAFIGGGSMLGAMSETPTGGMSVLPVMGVGGILFALTAGLALAMMFFYAPALIILRDISAIDAIKASFAGAWKNLLPFVIFMLIYAGLSIVASIPLGFWCCCRWWSRLVIAATGIFLSE